MTLVLSANFSDPAAYDRATPEQQLDFLTAQLRAIAVAAQQARERGDQAAIDRLLPLYRTLSGRAAQLRQRVNAAGNPSAFLVALDQFSDASLQVARAAGAPFVAAFESATFLTKLVPWLILGAFVVAAVFFLNVTGLRVGTVSLTKKGRR